MKLLVNSINLKIVKERLEKDNVWFKQNMNYKDEELGEICCINILGDLFIDYEIVNKFKLPRLRIKYTYPDNNIECVIPLTWVEKIIF